MNDAPALAADSPTPQPAGSQAASARPVGAGDYVVKQGDCISSIAVAKGLFWETIWNDPANKDLKDARKNPNVLLPGDRVTLPTKRRKEETITAEQRHRFRRRGEPTLLRLRLMKDDQPRANVPYVLEIAGQSISGKTDANGLLECPISGTTKRAKLTVGTQDDGEEYELHLGTLDPSDAVSGAQSRLNNLGFDCGDVDGELDEEMRAAVAAFQQSVGLDPTGELDAATVDKLRNVHDKPEGGSRG